jgi:MFS family permease
MPFYLIQGRVMNPAQAGMLMAVTSMVTMVIGPLSGALSDRYGPFKFSAIGAGAIGAAYGLMFAFDVQTPLTFIIPVLFLLGIGIGSFHPSNNSIIMGAVTRDHLGTASADQGPPGYGLGPDCHPATGGHRCGYGRYRDLFFRKNDHP